MEIILKQPVKTLIGSKDTQQLKKQVQAEPVESELRLCSPSPPIQQDGNFTPDWSSRAHRAPSPSAPNWRAIIPGQAGHQYFSSCPPPNCYWSQVMGKCRWEVGFLFLPSLQGGSTPGVELLRVLGPLVIPCWESQAKELTVLSLPPSLRTQLLN